MQVEARSRSAGSQKNVSTAVFVFAAPSTRREGVQIHLVQWKIFPSSGFMHDNE
jgi:hypothetical protein